MNELVIAATVHDYPNALSDDEQRQLETELVRVLADFLGITMKDDGSAGEEYMAPQVYVGVRTA